MFGMHTPLMVLFQMTPMKMTLGLTIVLKLAILDFVAARGIVFHKQMYSLFTFKNSLLKIIPPNYMYINNFVSLSFDCSMLNILLIIMMFDY